MKFNTLDNKKMSKDGSKVILSAPTVVFLDSTETIATHEVTEDEVGRVDLISLKYYRDSSYVDYILKWNNISNPFSIKFMDVILIPQKEGVLATVKPVKMVQKSTETISIRDQFIDTKRMPVKDAKRIEYLKRKAASKPNGPEQPLPPNMIQAGDENMTIGNGKISF